MVGRVISLASSEQTLAAATTVCLVQPSLSVWPGTGRLRPGVNAQTGESSVPD
jgi:hypothetical protein